MTLLAVNVFLPKLMKFLRQKVCYLVNVSIPLEIF